MEQKENQGKSQGKKVLLVVALLILAIVADFFMIRYRLDNPIEDENEDDSEYYHSAEYYNRLVTEDYPCRFVVYGGALVFNEGYNVDYIETITRENLELDTTKYEYEMVIINDLDGKADFSDEELSYILDKIYSEDGKRYSFFYLGKRQFERMLYLNVMPQSEIIKEGDLSIGLVPSGNTDMVYAVGGSYSETRKEYTPSSLFVIELVNLSIKPEKGIK